MAPPAQKPLLPIWQSLKAEGLQIDRMENGSPVVIDKDGNEFDIPIDQLLQRDGLKKDDIEIEWTSPDAPIQQSPVSTLDRAKLSFGNAAGNVEYLKKSFEDVKVSPDNGLVVKKDGAWHAVDPDLLGKGDAWDKTKAVMRSVAGMTPLGAVLQGTGVMKRNKDLKGDLAELGPEAINAVTTGVGAAVGAAGAMAASAMTFGAAAPGAVALPVAGAAAGAALSGSIRTSLGRMIGTYKADEAEQIEDIGLEMLYSAGGQAIGMGMKPTAEKLIAATKFLKNAIPEGAKEVFANVVGQLSRTGGQAMDVLMDDAASVMSRVKQYAGKFGGDTDKAVQGVADDQLSLVKNFLEKSIKKMPQKFGENLQALIQKADEKGVKMAVDFKELMAPVFQELEQAGVGTFKQNAQGVRTSFRELNPKQAAKALMAGITPEQITPEDMKIVRPLIETLMEMQKMGKAEGGKAVQLLRTFEGYLNKLGQSAYSGDNAGLQRIVSGIKGSYKTQLRGVFNKAGLLADYDNLMKPYIEFGDAMDFARSQLRATKGVETITKQLVTAPGKVNATTKGLVGSLVQMMGDDGAQFVKDLSLLHATEKFLPRAPKIGMVIGSALGGAAAKSVGLAGPLAVPLTGAAIAGSSPRLVGNVAKMSQGIGGAISKYSPVPYLQKSLDFVKGLPPQELKQLMSNPDLLQNLMRTTFTAYEMEEKDKEQLLKQSGVK